jgi:hypothetical protein
LQTKARFEKKRKEERTFRQAKACRKKRTIKSFARKLREGYIHDTFREQGDATSLGGASFQGTRAQGTRVQGIRMQGQMIGKYMLKEGKVAEKKCTFKLGTIMQGLGKRGISVCSLYF